MHDTEDSPRPPPRPTGPGTIMFTAIRPSGDPMRIVSAGSVRDCWNNLAASSGRSIAELKRAGWKVAREDEIAPVAPPRPGPAPKA